jgi:quercetin dioxygenase-like cupin family protein
MDVWDLDAVDVEPHKPQILLSDRGSARAIAIELPAGEALTDHEVHEHAWLTVVRGAVEVRAGDETRSGGAGHVFHWRPQERHEVRATEDARLLLLLAPWPGEGHPGARDA